MSSPRWPATPVTEVLALLDDVGSWRLPPQQWESVAQILQELADAYAVGDADAWDAAVADLSPRGPVRIVRIRHVAPIGVPREVLDRCSVLVHTLNGRPVIRAPKNASSDEPGGIEGRHIGPTAPPG